MWETAIRKLRVEATRIFLFSLRGGEFTCAQREFPHSHVNRCLFLAFSLVIVAAQEEDAPIRHPKSFCG